MRKITYICDKCKKEIKGKTFYTLQERKLSKTTDGSNVREDTIEVKDTGCTLYEGCKNSLLKELEPDYEADSEEPDEAGKAEEDTETETTIQAEALPNDEAKRKYESIENIRDKVQDGLNRGLNGMKISKEIGESPQRVSYCIKKLGLKRNPGNLNTEDVIRLYVDEGKDIATTAKELGVNISMLRSFIISNRIFKNDELRKQYEHTPLPIQDDWGMK